MNELRFVVDRGRPHLGGNVHGGDPRTFYPSLWDWLVREFRVGTVLDVGCGEGHAMEEFVRAGAKPIGLDGLAWNVEKASAHGPAILCDLTRFSLAMPGVDLVWCCEVVEHVAEEHVEKLLDTICCGRVLAMTHAVPGQGGHHHVNCREAAYWIGAIGERGYRLDLGATAQSRTLADGYWGATGMIFRRSDV